jgi:hypothetical protein
MQPNEKPMISPAWYHGSREDFLASPSQAIADQLAGRAASENLEIEANQNAEWRRSVDLLQKTLDERLPILQAALKAPGCEQIRHVILEYDFHRRGLRMDCVLLGDGVLFVVEFKRTKIQRADRDQVMTYAVNLLEFHKATQELSKADHGIIIVPIIALTEGRVHEPPSWPGLGGHSWSAMTSRPMECDKLTLGTAIGAGIENRISSTPIPQNEWLNSPFRPSSSILDAALSLYGNHDVVAIQEHSAPKAEIDASIAEIRERIQMVLAREEYHERWPQRTEPRA